MIDLRDPIWEGLSSIITSLGLALAVFFSIFPNKKDPIQKRLEKIMTSKSFWLTVASLISVFAFGLYLGRKPNQVVNGNIIVYIFSNYSIYIISVMIIVIGIFISKMREPSPNIGQTSEMEPYSDYDKKVQEIANYLKTIVDSKVCDLATIYIRDEIDTGEFNLIAHYGLHYSSPMYGPLVFDDFRHNLERARNEIFVSKVATSNENKKGFKVREEVASRASFKLNDENGSPFAALYLNWRKNQTFPKPQKKVLNEHKNWIFSMVEKFEGTSKDRQLADNAELRARRWIDYNITMDKFKNFDQLIFETIYHFLEEIDRRDLSIEIATKNNGDFISKQSPYQIKYDINLIKPNSTNNESLYEWVIDTTRPIYLSPDENVKSGNTNSSENNTENALDIKSSDYKIIVPIRSPSNLSECQKVILIECPKALKPDMVKPLCYLADHFGRIEEERNNDSRS